jgi:hypothetical protein
MATTSRRRRVTGRDFPEDGEEEETTTRRRKRPEPEPDDVEETNDEVQGDSADEDEEEPAPRARKRSRRVSVDRDEVEEEGDEESAFDDTLINRGWGAVEKNAPKGDWTNDFKFREEPQIVKFLDDEPWDYMQHWVQRDGKQSFTCGGPGCPLCKVGVKVTQKIVFPIVNFGETPEDEPEVMNLVVGRRLLTTLEGYHKAKTTGPLTRLYWAMSKTGERLKTQHHVQAVKDRDLEEDWEYDLDAVEDFLSTAKAPDPKDAITWDSKATLKAIADEIME